MRHPISAFDLVYQRLSEAACDRIIFTKQSEEGFFERGKPFPCAFVLLDTIHAVFNRDELRKSACACLAGFVREGGIIGRNFFDRTIGCCRPLQ